MENIFRMAALPLYGFRSFRPSTISPSKTKKTRKPIASQRYMMIPPLKMFDY